MPDAARDPSSDTEDDHAVRRDARILFRDGWMLILFLVCFGAAACGLFWWSSPRGSAGWVRFGVSVVLVLVAGGIVAPLVTRALYRKR